MRETEDLEAANIQGAAGQRDSSFKRGLSVGSQQSQMAEVTELYHLLNCKS